MKKRIFAMVCAFVLCFTWAVPAFAVSDEGYVVDDTGTFSESEIKELNDRAAQLSQKTGVEILFLKTDQNGDTAIEDYAMERMNVTPDQDSILFAQDDDYWCVHFSGARTQLFTDEDADALWNAYRETSGFYDGVEGYFTAAEQLLNQPEDDRSDAASNTGTHVAVPILDENDRKRVVDLADLIGDSDEAALRSKLDEISERQRLDVIVVTTNTLNDLTPRDYADDFFDYNGYGIGANRDGVLLLISMEDRDYWISTRGYGIRAFTDAGISYIASQFKSDLSDGNYAAAFNTFADECDRFITQAREDRPYDTSTLPRTPPGAMWLVVVAVPSLILAFIVVGCMKRKLKSVRPQPGANSYVRPGSMNVAYARDIFLYSHVTRTARPKDDDHGGSSTHESSSGATHGGGGGKF